VTNVLPTVAAGAAMIQVARRLVFLLMANALLMVVADAATSRVVINQSEGQVTNVMPTVAAGAAMIQVARRPVFLLMANALLMVADSAALS